MRTRIALPAGEQTSMESRGPIEHEVEAELQFYRLIDQAREHAIRAREAIRLESWKAGGAIAYGLGACEWVRVIGRLRTWTWRVSRGGAR
jgi:hypothetical protein